jgi:hypothetical protein
VRNIPVVQAGAVKKKAVISVCNIYILKFDAQILEILSFFASWYNKHYYGSISCKS